MKSISYVIVICAISLMSCGGGGQPEETSLSPIDIQVSGDLSDYLTVVDGTYKVSYAGGDLILPVKLKGTNPVQDLEYNEIRAEILDETGMPVTGLGTFYISSGLWAAADDNAKVEELLKNGTGETAVQLIYSSWGGAGTKEAMKLVQKGKTFQIFTEASEVTKTAVATSSSGNVQSSQATKSTSGGTNWDSILDDYEKFVDSYVKLLKKANDGDLSAMTEYITALEKATVLSDKLDDASDDLSVSQMTRFAKIQQKITDAALEMM
jgi:hypothetical protein